MATSPAASPSARSFSSAGPSTPGDHTPALSSRSRREKAAEAEARAEALAELREVISNAKVALRLDTDITINLSDRPIGDDAVGELAPLIGRCQKLTKIMCVPASAFFVVSSSSSSFVLLFLLRSALVIVVVVVVVVVVARCQRVG